MERIKNDLSGKTYGKLTVLNKYEKRGNKTYWLCQCECGSNPKFIRSDHLKNGSIISCGCNNKNNCSKLGELKREDLTGHVFGRLKVIKFAYSKNNEAYWKCKCECGTIKEFPRKSLVSKNTTSCGCYRSEKMKKIMSCNKNPSLGKTGDKSWNWKSSLSEEERLLNKCRTNTSEYQMFRRIAFSKNGKICYCCGNESGKRVIHHLNGWSLSTQERYDINNTVTLCEKCHKDFHSMYGYGNNTKEQFEEYNKLIRTEGYAKHIQGQRIDGEKI